jgi:geranylgeranyl reductase family protein
MHILEQRYQAIVVGAGPAGSSAAATLGAAGKRTLLVDRDRFPREKICGDGITFKCLPALERLGVLEAFFRAIKFKTTGYSLWFTDGTELTMRQATRERGAPVWVLPRYDFDQLILDAALRHPSVELREDYKVDGLLFDGESVVGVRGTHDGKPVVDTAPLVIDACGANSALAVEVGAGNRDPRKCALAIRGYYDNVSGLSDTIELYFDEAILPGYFWVFPTSPSSANVGCGTFQHLVEERKIDLRAVLNGFCESHPIARDKLGRATLCGTLKGGKIPLGLDKAATRVRDGMVMIGDAASFTDPITAEGISYALKSGIMAGEVGAQAIDRGDCRAASLARYDELWQKEFSRQFSRAPVLTTAVPKEVFAGQMLKSFSDNRTIDAMLGNLGLQYELMVKLKVLFKVL